MQYANNVRGIGGGQLHDKCTLSIRPRPDFFFHAVLQAQQDDLIACGCFAGSLVAYSATDSISGKSGERARSANKQQEGAPDSRTDIHKNFTLWIASSTNPR
jgi:hypothetical protein